MTTNILTEFSFNPIVSKRITNLTAQYADLVHCPVCGYLLWKPVTCNSCENSFCFQCIQIWLSEQQEAMNASTNDDLAKSFSLTRCPFNCSPYIQRRCPPLLNSILSKLTIECRYKIHGCEQILFYEQLEKHEEEICQYKTIRCPGCQQDLFQEDFDHLSTCLYVDVQCMKCQSIFPRKDKHDRLNCMEKQMDLFKQQLIALEEKSSMIFDLQRRKIDLLNEKFDVIESIWGTDDDDNEQIDIPRHLVSTSSQSSGEWYRMNGKEIVILVIVILFIYISMFFC